MTTVRREFIAPLGDEAMRCGVGAWGSDWRSWFWRFYIAICLAALPLSFPLLFGYIFWCRWMEKRCEH